MLRVFPCCRDAAHEYGFGKPSLLKAFDPALQPADGALRDIFLILRGSGQEINIAKSVFYFQDMVMLTSPFPSRSSSSAADLFIILPSLVYAQVLLP